MPARSRKRGRRQKTGDVATATGTPTATADKAPAESDTSSHVAAVQGRYDDRNAAARAQLKPLAPGERPTAVTISAALAALAGVGNLIAYVAGAKIAGRHPAPTGILGFSALMAICTVGLWRLRSWAVLGFMALLAVIATIFTLLLLKASNLLGFLVPPVIIAGAGYLFMKLVRALSRIQMPKAPDR